ncbi:unnamed protein product [Brassica rapa]|uniref:Uncharacterized protein n=1 Tax=Brassica campestris TaxID=3711 RepID=A0A3P5YD74_BRACM|nr:unnamed protein product [Brassica rapa]VDC60585.1 unnamed protein product [Brassica rapa]
MFFLSDGSTHAKLVEITQEDYNLNVNIEVMDLTYSLSDEMMQHMAPDTPPIHVTSRTRIVGDANIDGNQDGEDVDGF